MSEPTEDPTFPVRIVDTNGQLRIEISYKGEGDPPWWGETGACRSRADAAVQAAVSIEGVTHVHEGLTSSVTLRLYVAVDREHDRGTVTRAVVEALLDVVRG